MSVLIFVALLMAVQTAYAASLSNHVITADPLANSNCQTPAAKNTFSPSDNEVYQWVSISNAFFGDRVEWRWFSPDNSVYSSSSSPLNFLGDGCAWQGISISGHQAANLPGNWKVELYLNGTLAATSNFTIAGLPAPNNLRFTISGHMLTITWDAVSGAAGYNLLLGLTPGSYFAPIDMGNTTQVGPIDVSGASGTFYLAVQAYSGSIRSSNSNEIAITIGSSGIAAPQNFRYTLNGNILTLQWDAVAGAAGYRIVAGTQSGNYIAGPVDLGNVLQLPLDITGVTGTYYLAVEAYDSSQTSGYSNEIAVTLGIAAPQNFRYTLNGNILTLQWDAVAGAAGYRIVAGMQSGNYIAGPVDLRNVLQLPIDITGVTGTYYMAVEAYDSSETSGHSNEVAIKLGSTNPQPFDTSGLTSTLFGALGQYYNPNITPSKLTTLKNAFLSGGLGALATLLTGAYPQIITQIPNGIVVNYGNGYTDELGDLMSGSITATYSNFAASGGTWSGNYALVVDNLHANGNFLADGSASGSFSFSFAPKLVADVSISGIVNAAGLKAASSLLGVRVADFTASGTYGSVSGSVHIDRNQCPNFPISGSVTYTIGGQTNTVTFNNNCNTSAYGVTTGGGPVITSLTPNSGKPGDNVTIAGTGFGATQGSSTVTFAGTAAQVVSWSDTSIVAQVPNITSTGDVIVTVAGIASNGVQFAVINQCSVQQVSGADTPETRIIDLGINHGTFQFDYETYAQQDEIIVSYEGTVLYDTGCVGAGGTQYLTYSGTSTTITVEVRPNCAGGTGTAWNFTVYCP